MWHVSVSIPDENGAPLLVSTWSYFQMRQAAKRIYYALLGVGIKGSDVPVIGQVTLQSRRLLTEEEIKMLPQDKLPNSFADHPIPRW